MAWRNDTELGIDILEIFFEAQRHGCDELTEEQVLLSRRAHRSEYQREWAEDSRGKGYCANPPRTEFRKCKRPKCARLIAVKVRSPGRPREFHSRACYFQYRRELQAQQDLQQNPGDSSICLGEESSASTTSAHLPPAETAMAVAVAT